MSYDCRAMSDLHHGISPISTGSGDKPVQTAMATLDAVLVVDWKNQDFTRVAPGHKALATKK